MDGAFAKDTPDENILLLSQEHGTCQSCEATYHTEFTWHILYGKFLYD